MIMNIATFLASIESLEKTLQNQDVTDEKLLINVEKITSTLESEWMKRIIESSENDSSKKHLSLDKIVQVAVRVWNTTVAKHAGRSLSDKGNALLRQMCFDLVSCGVGAFNRPNVCRDEIKRCIMMGIKVSKAWFDIGAYDKSSQALEITKKNIESSTEMISCKGPTGWYLEYKTSLQQDLFSVYCLMSEISSSRGNVEEAFKLADKAVNLSFISGCIGDDDGKFNAERDKFCALTYNFGLRAANKQNYEVAIRWLSKSFEAGKRRTNIRKAVLARILRLLAHVYSELRTEDGDKKALNAVELANEYVNHPSGLHLRLKILARNTLATNDEVEEAFFKLLHHQDLSVELALSSCRHLNINGRYDLSEKGLQSLIVRYTGSPHIAKIQAQRFECKLHKLNGDEALAFAQSFLRDNEVVSSTDRESRKTVHLLMWEQAERHQEKGDTEKVLEWYDLSLKLHAFDHVTHDVTGDEIAETIAKIHRNRASCLLSLGRYEEAKKAALDAAKLARCNPRTDFTLFKVAVSEGNKSEALEAIERLVRHFKNASVSDQPMHVDGDACATVESDANIHGLVCLAAQLAFEHKQKVIAMTALQYVSDTTSDRVAKLVTQRCLVRLHLRVMEEIGDSSIAEERKQPETFIENILLKATESVEAALKILQDLGNRCLSDAEIKSRELMSIASQSNAGHELIQDEAEWFMKICWNMALESKNYPMLMKKLFHLCHKFLSLLAADKAVLTRQKTCLLMSCAAALEVARSTSKPEELESQLRFALEQINEHRAICRRIHQTDGETSQREEKEAILRSLYEFEAYAKLTRRDRTNSENETRLNGLERLFETIIMLPHATMKTFETVAALCVDSPANHVNMSKRALKIAIRKLDSQDISDNQDMKDIGNKYSVLYRHLIDLALQDGSSIDPSSKEEALCYVRDALQLVDGKMKKFYPELECLWLTIRSWNIGARLYIAGHLLEAEKWCSIAMRFLNHLKHYKTSYEAHMSEVYQEILSKKDSGGLDGKESQAMEIA